MKNYELQTLRQLTHVTNEGQVGINDPYQLHNLADNPEFSKALEEMQRLLDNWIIKYDDKIPGNPTPDTFDRWTGERL